jgi:hypothetical protein
MNFAGCCAEKKHANQELDAGSLHLENRELDADAGSLPRSRESGNGRGLSAFRVLIHVLGMGSGRSTAEPC